ncbi:TetR/AcrR family transcriptional regulator [Puia sp. P3]|uniref:TetR/AcrR family transcriptional regulator n=1 Tax=Puia sp. P3 TaxID=3423952 RepID=UPI003D67DE7E
MTQPRGQQVVDKIMDATNKLFYRQGYNVTGINQIIEEAGIAKGSLYQHFESKTDLLVGYIELNHQAWFTRVTTHIDSVLDPKEKLLALFDYHISRQELREYGGCPFIKANDEAGMADPRVLESIRRVKQQSKDMIRELVVNSGHKQLLSDEELTELIFLAVEGELLRHRSLRMLRICSR